MKATAMMQLSTGQTVPVMMMTMKVKLVVKKRRRMKKIVRSMTRKMTVTTMKMKNSQ